jgi:hypothetical protein
MIIHTNVVKKKVPKNSRLKIAPDVNDVISRLASKGQNPKVP